MNAKHVTPSRPSVVGRRTLLATAAWATPTIAVATTAPAHATSNNLCDEVITVEAYVAPPSTTNLTQNYEAASETFTVPAGVTSIAFEVAGGGGGVNRNFTDYTISHPGGDGDLVSGVLAVTPGDGLTLVAAQGGIGPTETGAGTPANTKIKGGAGYGEGGDLPTGGSQYRYAGGSGGGASAILVGDQPVIVAGGGGGSGGGTPGGEFEWVEDAGGGNGGVEADGGTHAAGRWSNVDTSQYVYQAEGGGGAAGEEPGAAPNNNGGSTEPQPDPADDTSHPFAKVYGTHGSPSTPGQGGRGADGSCGLAMSGYQYTSGAGGGGHAGGASGDALTAQGSESQFAASMGGGGGGGSSFVCTVPVGGVSVQSASHSSADNGDHASLQRNPGWVKLTYDIC